MDKYRIKFKCLKEPKGQNGLEGYLIDKDYTGRTFNGLFEIAPRWGSGDSTKLIDKSTFFKYFDLIKDQNN